MLLSAIGESDRLVHERAELAFGVLRAGERCRVLRTAWRVKTVKEPPGTGENKRPDFMELLTGLAFTVFVRDGADSGTPTLARRVSDAVSAPAIVARFGGLSLGESTMLVDDFRRVRAGDVGRSGVSWVVADPSGELALPLWADHVASYHTRYGQFRLLPAVEPEAGKLPIPPVSAWTRIERPD